MTYDSTEDTTKHIKRVQELCFTICSEIMKRGFEHDKSKLDKIEKDLFDDMSPKLKGCTYGSEEYYEFLKKLAPALENHYKVNSHHPEFHKEGFSGMTLIDLIECFADWKAATERHADGDLKKSIEINSKRFNMPPQLTAIFENTRKSLNL